MDFPLKDSMDEGVCYRKLVELLHPKGLACPRCGQQKRLGIHNRHREPVLDYRCSDCGRVFNAWTGTVLQGTHRRPREILLILHGVATGEPTARMARELNRDRKHLLDLRHRLQEHARRWLDRNPLGDAVVEADGPPGKGRGGPVLDRVRISMVASTVPGDKRAGGYAIETREPSPLSGNRPLPSSISNCPVEPRSTIDSGSGASRRKTSPC